MTSYSKKTNKKGIAEVKQKIYKETSTTATHDKTGLTQTVTFNTAENFSFDFVFDYAGKSYELANAVNVQQGNKHFIISGIVYKTGTEPAVDTELRFSMYRGKLSEVIDTVTDKYGRFVIEVDVPKYDCPYVYQLAITNYCGGYEWRNSLELKRWKIPLILLAEEDKSYYDVTGTAIPFNFAENWICCKYPLSVIASQTEDYSACYLITTNRLQQGYRVDSDSSKSIYCEAYLIALSDEVVTLKFSISQDKSVWNTAMSSTAVDTITSTTDIEYKSMQVLMEKYLVGAKTINVVTSSYTGESSIKLALSTNIIKELITVGEAKAINVRNTL